MGVSTILCCACPHSADCLSYTSFPTVLTRLLLSYHFVSINSTTLAEDIICNNLEETHSGFFQSVEIGFEDVTMVLKQKKKKGTEGNGERVILDGSIRGIAKPGRMLAIMGPSGSGS